MSFRTNLQYLRAERHMTQEQLAMLLGVSRQSVTKWEAEKSYPEMDKLIKMCQIFECSLDDLVQGDLTDRAWHPPSLPCRPVPRRMCVAMTTTCARLPSEFPRVSPRLSWALWGSCFLRKGRLCAACSIAVWLQVGASFWGWPPCSPACLWALASWFLLAWSTLLL